MSETPFPPIHAVDRNEEAPVDSPARRDFLMASAAVAGASLVGACGSDADTTDSGSATTRALQRFEHVVVVMFENRSIDNLLGYLYPQGTVPRNQTYNGLSGAAYSNPVPAYIGDGRTSVSTRMSPGTDADMSNPNPDPGEGYTHVNTQLFGIVDPPSNEFKATADMLPPYNAPPSSRQPPTMQGFVHDYCNNFVVTRNRMPTFDEYRVVMDGFGPDSLPVINTLAREFAVFDAWFCSVPTQTFCNRSFFHAASSSGNVVNTPYSKWLTNAAPTIFNRLEDAGVSWKIYFDPLEIISLTGLIHAPALFPYWKTRFATMDTFYKDMAEGTLPAYAFVEPRMLWFHNDYHPPSPTFTVDHVPIGLASDVRAGDLLLHNIYNAFRTTTAATGSTALNTLMLVTFDEHGGTFDHVAPGPATPPYNPQPAGEFGFMFDRMGLRVPAIAISAHTEAGTVINRPMDHTALVRTLCLKHGLPHLTERDRTAPDLTDAYNLDSVRPPSTWPVTVPRPVSAAALATNPLADDVAAWPLTDLGRDIVALAMAHFQGREPAANEIPATIGTAYTLVSQIAKGAFGPG